MVQPRVRGVTIGRTTVDLLNIVMPSSLLELRYDKVGYRTFCRALNRSRPLQVQKSRRLMLLIKSWDLVFVTGSAGILFLAQCVAQSPSVSSGQRAGAIQFAGPVTWGSPDQRYGKRRPVTAAGRVAIENYRSGRKAPIFATNFSEPAELNADWDLVSDDNQWGDYQSRRRPGNVEA